MDGSVAGAIWVWRPAAGRHAQLMLNVFNIVLDISAR